MTERGGTRGGCKQRGAAAAALAAGAADVGVDDGYPGNGRTPNSRGNRWAWRRASWRRCSGEDGRFAFGAAGCSEAKEREAWTVPSPKVCLFHISLALA